MKPETVVRRVTWAGLAVNILLSFIKIGAGILGQSQAVLADGVHSISDTITDVAVIAGSYYWVKPPDQSHPYGHRRLETVVSIFIGVVILTAGCGIGWKALTSHVLEPHDPPGMIALAAACLSLTVKEILYRWTAGFGTRLKSVALSSNAWHHRLDAISSIPALLAVGGAILVPGWYFLDHIGAVVVAVLIIFSALKIIWAGMNELIDVGAPRETCGKIKEIVCQHPEVQDVHKIRTRYLGNNLQVDLHLVINGDLSVRHGHDIAGEIRHRLIDHGPGIIDVIVHIEPSEAKL